MNKFENSWGIHMRVWLENSLSQLEGKSIFNLAYCLGINTF